MSWQIGGTFIIKQQRNIKIYKTTAKSATGQEDDYTTGCFFDCFLFHWTF